MNERVFGKILMALMSVSLACTLLVPAVRIGRVFWTFVISLSVGILAVSAYVRYRNSRERVTPMSVISFLWLIFCSPLILVVGAVVFDATERHSSVYQDALKIAKSSEISKSQLGPDISVGWPIEGEIEKANGSSRTVLLIPVSGNRGRGSFRVRGSETHRTWQVDDLALELPDGTVREIKKSAHPPTQSGPPSTADAKGALDERSAQHTEVGAISNLSDKTETKSLLLEVLSPWYMIVICCLIGPVFFIVAIPYTLTLQNALMKCAPQCRAMHQSLLWLLFLPFIGLITNFLAVSDLADSFHAEFRRRGVPSTRDNTRKIGVAMNVCWVCSFFPLVGIPAIIASPVLWIVYWRRITKLSRRLDSLPVAPA